MVVGLWICGYNNPGKVPRARSRTRTPGLDDWAGWRARGQSLNQIVQCICSLCLSGSGVQRCPGVTMSGCMAKQAIRRRGGTGIGKSGPTGLTTNSNRSRLGTYVGRLFVWPAV